MVPRHMLERAYIVRRILICPAQSYTLRYFISSLFLYFHKSHLSKYKARLGQDGGRRGEEEGFLSLTLPNFFFSPFSTKYISLAIPSLVA